MTTTTRARVDLGAELHRAAMAECEATGENLSALLRAGLVALLVGRGRWMHPWQTDETDNTAQCWLTRNGLRMLERPGGVMPLPVARVRAPNKHFNVESRGMVTVTFPDGSEAAAWMDGPSATDGANYTFSQETARAVPACLPQASQEEIEAGRHAVLSFATDAEMEAAWQAVLGIEYLGRARAARQIAVWGGDAAVVRAAVEKVGAVAGLFWGADE
jgi:hypothetical protein